MFTHSKKHKTLRQTFAWVLSLAMICSNLTMIPVQAETVSGSTVVATVSDGNGGAVRTSSNVHIFDAGSLELAAKGSLVEKSTIVSGDFTLLCHGNTAIEEKATTFEDGYTSTKRISLGGTMTTEKAGIKFTTTAPAEVTVYWVCGGDGREIKIIDEAGTEKAITAVTPVKNDQFVSTLSLEEAGTYILGSASSSNYIFRIVVEEEVTETATEMVFDAGSLELAAKGSLEEKSTIVSGDFTLLCHGNTAIEEKATTFEDGYTSTKRISLGGTMTTEKAGIKFTTTAPAEVTVYWVCGGDGREIKIIDEAGTEKAITAVTPVKNDQFVSTLSLAEAGTYILGSANSSNYIFRIVVKQAGGSSGEGENTETVTYDSVYNFCDGSIVPTDTTNGTATVQSADGKLTLACGPSNGYGYNGAQHGAIFKDGNNITISVLGNAVIKIAGCQYTKADATATLSKGGVAIETKNLQTAACWHNDETAVVTFNYEGEAADLVLTFNNNTAYVPNIVVTRTEPKPEVTEVTANVTINDEKSLIGSNKVTLVNKADETDVVDVTAGGNFTLKVNATYNVVTDNADIAATVAGKTSIVTATENLAVTVDVVSTVVHPVVTFVDEENVIGSAVLKLTNQADATDEVTLVNGEKAKLKIDATYVISSSLAEVVASVGGSVLVKATAEMTEIKVDIAEADLTHHTYDVWDFGAEQLANTDLITYVNKLNADKINAWYPGVAAGTKGVCIGDVKEYDADGNLEFAFNAGGKVNNRHRTNNSALTRYDDKQLVDIVDSSIVYTGYIYSNSSKSEAVNIQLNVKAGDIVKLIVSSNGTSSDITWKAPSKKTSVQTYNGKSSNAQEMTFYCAESGLYTVYSATEKLVVARIYRERPNTVTVSGDVTGPAGVDLNGAELVFTNQTTGQEIKTTIANNAYSAALLEQYTYDIRIDGASGYIVGENNTIKLKNEAGNTDFDVEIIAVDLVEVTGSLADLTADAAAALKLTFTSDMVYVPEITVDAANATYTGKFERGITYTVSEAGVNDYTLETLTFKADAAGTQNIKFTKKPVYAVTVTVEGPTADEAKNIALTLTNINEEGYVYNYTGTEGIELRDGQYKVTAVLEGYTQHVTSDIKVNGAAASKTIVMDSTAVTEVPYSAEITVGADKTYKTINDALEAVRNMNRTDDQRVVISIDPGNYEEMLVVDVNNVTLKNASATPSIALKDKGVNIDDNAVRITSYYGHGYTYYSMGSDCKYDADLLAVNKENGYASFANPGSGTTSGSYWNATVVIAANGFEADGIIFENSFNQYMSAKAAEDVIVKQGAAKEGSTPRASMKAGDVTVQQKAYVERAAAFAIMNDKVDLVLNNCKFVGRQDTLYGGTGVYAEFNECSIYGGTDYIFGGMTAIFNKCDLVFNTSEDNNDVGYITAAQQKSGRGYLMYECHVTSTTPGVDTASAYTSKPGYFGRPWQADTSEVVFYNTIIDEADAHWGGGSLIKAEGWLNTLSGESAGMYEYNTTEKAADVTTNRVAWATALTEPVLNDGTEITLEAFRRFIPEEGIFIIDLKDGLKKGVVYDGGISVLEDMAYKAIDGAGDEIGGTLYPGYVAGSSNPKTDGASAAGTVPDAGSVLKLVAEKNGKIKLAVKINSGKTLYFVEEGSTKEAKAYTNSGASSEYAVMSYDVEAGKTYYFYGNGTKVPMYGITVDYREPIAWAEIATPAITGTKVEDDTITVSFDAMVGGRYADSVDIVMMENGEAVETISYAAESESGSVEFVPAASGSYTFKAVLKRAGEIDKAGNASEAVAFVLPMAAPVIISAENQGNGVVRFSWKEVAEADSYKVYVDGELVATVEVPFHRVEGLTAGTEYEFAVEAIGNDDVSERSSVKQTITVESKKNWLYAAFGSGVDTKNNGYSGSVDNGDLSLWSLSGKGKLVPASTDGLAFYYTVMDPKNENFTISADITVDNWKYSNGQEGFGMMVADTVGENGDASTFWNNSYMATVTKVEYYWDSVNKVASDSGDKYSMKLGIGSQEKIGVTPANIAKGDTINYFTSKMSPLDVTAAKNGYAAGTYNIVDNYTNAADELAKATTNLSSLKTTFHLEIQRNNTGYFISYTDEAGNKTTKKYYHGDEGDELTKLDENNIYVGFFASRNAKINVSNVEVTTINPADDLPAEDRPITLVTPNYTIESSKVANSADYEMVYYGNADGKLTIIGAAGTIVEDMDVLANTKVRIPTTLTYGKNKFTITFTPDPDYKPSKYEALSYYHVEKFNFTVEYMPSNREVVYVSPNGKASNTGDKTSPLDIYTAVDHAIPGQYIVLLEGRYELQKTVTVQRGIDGTADKMIYLVADPDATGRPVLDFNGMCAGMVLAGNYWYLQGFDVTASSAGQKGLQVSGDYNVVDNVNAYRNGNTGIQISRFKGTDLYEDWPSYNLILNCTSYLNADPGYEDADGFAAKLTIADGNVFDGCIAAYNADDGWDLFAKVESGPIGKVVIKNCLAFKNGYDIDANGNEINAGNGNGFKMGGSSISGYHLLENSIAFANKAKGIDSNSCPDIQVVNCTSFNNGSYNVALYTNDATNTDYSVDGVISFKDANGNTEGESIKTKGSQDLNKIYKTTNYFFPAGNTTGVKATADWFVHLNTDAAISLSGSARTRSIIANISRYDDNTINMNGYLELTANAPADAGARMTGTASLVITIPTNGGSTTTPIVPPSTPATPSTPVTPAEPTATKAPAASGESTSPKTYDDSVWFDKDTMPEKPPVDQTVADTAEDSTEATETIVVSGAADAEDVAVLVGVEATENAFGGEGAMWLIVIAVMGVFSVGLGITAKRYLKKEEE